MKTRLGVLFGGITVEHEVSIVTAVQLMKHARENYDVVPVYIDKTGHWWTGEALFDIAFYRQADLQNPQNLESFTLNPNPGENDLDVAILCFHGQYGESGKVQGLLDLAQIPYQGPGVTSSAISFDKIHLRQIFSAENIPQPKYVWFTQDDWQNRQAKLLKKIDQTLQYPLFVKPANGGSTVGIEKVKDLKGLATAVKNVLHFDTRVLIEQGITDCIEINVSVLGTTDQAETSVPEQPLNQDEFLSYADKYERGGGKKSGMASASRRIPAPISDQTTKKVQELAKKVFYTLGCSGLIRIDFFVNPSTDEMYVVEPNTIPGSMSYYLWDATNLPYPKLIDRLVEIAKARWQKSQSLTHSYESNILQKAGESL